MTNEIDWIPLEGVFLRRGPLDNKWQDIDVVIPGVGTVILQRQGDTVTEWGIVWDKDNAFKTLTGENDDKT